jgi:hypothetical protein
MSLSLAEVRAQVSVHLNDTGKLIWTDTLLDSSIRSALQALGGVLDEALTLDGLDEATETSLAEDYQQALVVGAVAHALSLRVIGKFEDARTDGAPMEELADWAGKQMARFERLLVDIRLQSHQTAEGGPYDAWDWEAEG